MRKSEIMVWLNQAIEKITMRKFEGDNLSGLTAIERLYLYIEIKIKYNLLISANQINNGILASRDGIAQYITQHVATLIS